MSDSPSPSLVSAFEEAKNDLIELVRTRSETLPSEYGYCTTRATATVDDIAKADETLTHLAPKDRRRYILSLLINETNDFLQSLHDVAEDRCIRGEVLCDEEVAYITEVNDLYYLLLKDLAPIFNPDMTAPDVVQLQEGGQSLSMTSPERGKEKMSAAVSSIVKDKGTLDQDLLLRDEEIATFKTMYIQRVREKLVRHGIVVQKSTFSQNLRYIFLTNFQLIVTESLYLPRSSLDLSTITKVASTKTNHFSISTTKKTFSFFSKEAKDWVQDIEAAVATVSQLQEDEEEGGEEEATPSLEEYDIIVHVKQVEDLKNRKSRPDNPYFYAGVGDPLHYGQDRRNRQKSAVKEGTTSPPFDEQVFLSMSASREYLLDLRFYSHVKGHRNDFGYGWVQVPLEEIFVVDDHALEGWYDIEGGGRVELNVKLQKWAHNRLPPPRQLSLPAILSHQSFELHEKIPLVFGKNKEIVGVIRVNGSSVTLIDSATKKRLYTLTKSGFFKKEHTVSDENGVFAKCFHKMKTFKKKIRMFLSNSEFMFSISGGCFDKKTYDNEVYIQSSTAGAVASLVLGEEEDGKEKTRVVIVNVLDPKIDSALMVIFAIYAMRTL